MNKLNRHMRTYKGLYINFISIVILFSIDYLIRYVNGKPGCRLPKHGIPEILFGLLYIIATMVSVYNILISESNIQSKWIKALIRILQIVLVLIFNAYFLLAYSLDTEIDSL